MTDEPEPPRRRPGRPPGPTGHAKPRRHLRVGPEWDTAATLAANAGETTTAFVTRAIRNEIQRVADASG